MKKYNVAIVGLGFGAEFIPIYLKHPLANMYAICQRNEDKLNSIGDAYGIETRYTDFDTKEAQALPSLRQSYNKNWLKYNRTPSTRSSLT